MKTLELNGLILLLFLLCFGCKEDGELTDLQQNTDRNTTILSKEGEACIKAFDVVKHFSQTAGRNAATKAGSDTEIRILRIERQTLSFHIDTVAGSELPLTKTSANEPAQTEIELYTFVFEKDGERGYSMATGDERISGLLAYTEEGYLSDTLYNEGLAMTIAAFPAVCKQRLERYYHPVEDTLSVVTKGRGTTGGAGGRGTTTRKNIVFGPLITTHWDQYAPYNNYTGTTCPVGQGNGGHALAGCVPIAGSQVYAYINRNKTAPYNFQAMTAQLSISPSSPYADGVGQLVQYVSSFCKMNYGCDNSTTNLNYLESFFDNQGLSVNYKKGNIDMNQLCRNLNSGLPHLTGGYRKSVSVGHAWIWDGIQADVTETSGGRATVGNSANVYQVHSVTALHCNWGWGNKSDGWFASYEQPREEPSPYNHNNEQLYLNEYKKIRRNNNR